jgi:GT2 family glycosyltransferase
MDRIDDLRRCLTGLRSLRYPDFETLVFDNGSRDGTPELVRQQFPEVTLFRSETNLGTCISRNIMIRASSGEFVWFLDSDTVVADPDIVTALVEAMQSDPGIGVIGGEAILDEEQTVIGVKSFELTPNCMIIGHRLLDVPRGHLHHSDVLPTCNFFARREALERAGGFDPWYFFYMEDRDLSYRIARLGYSLKVLGKTPLLHGFSEKERKVDIVHIARNRMYFAIKHMPLSRLLLFPLLDLVYAVHPSNLFRVLRFSRSSSHGTRRVTIEATRGSRSPNLRGFGSGAVKTYQMLASMFAGYISILKHMGAALTARRGPKDHLLEADPAPYRGSDPPVAPTAKQGSTAQR